MPTTGPKHPGFERKLREEVVNRVIGEKRFGTYGIINYFDPIRRMASVIVASPGTNAPGRVFKQVPVPTNLGVQGIDPQPGQQCWIEFKDGEESFPMIVAFFNHDFQNTDWSQQQHAPNPVPRYMLS